MEINSSDLVGLAPWGCQQEAAWSMRLQALERFKTARLLLDSSGPAGLRPVIEVRRLAEIQRELRQIYLPESRRYTKDTL